MPESVHGRAQQPQASHDGDEPAAARTEGAAEGATEGAVDAPALLWHLARTSGVTPDTVAAALRHHRSERLRAAVLAEISARWGNAAVQRTLEAERRLPGAHPNVLGAGASDSASIAGTRSASPPILLPDADHPSRRDLDGEQVIQTDQATGPGKAALIRNQSWKALAEVAEAVDLQDDRGDTLHIDLTYRLESRPAEVGDVPEMWIHTERKALLTIGSASMREPRSLARRGYGSRRRMRSIRKRRSRRGAWGPITGRRSISPRRSST